MKKNNLLFITAVAGLTLGLASCNTPASVAVESVTISGPTEVVIGNTITLTATVAPENASDKEITWSSEQPNFATVNQAGVVSAVAVGTVTIKATAKNGKFGTYQVTVKPVDVASVTISGPTTVEKGSHITLTAAVSPDNATVKDLTWSSETPAVASVDGGVVTGVSKGVATIKATANNGIFGSYTVTVTEHFSITYPTGTDMIFAGPTSAEEGEYVSFSITTNTALASVTANGKECGIDDSGYFFYMPAEAVTIAVREATIPPVVRTYTINNKSNVVSIIGPTEAAAGEEVSLSVAVNPGYQLRDAKVYSNISAFDPEDRTLVEATFAQGVLEFTMPEEPVDVEFDVLANSYELTFVCDNADALAQVSNVYNAEGTVIRTVEGETRHVPYGTRVKVVLSNNNTYYNKKVIATGLRIDGVDYLCEDGSTDVFFTMPYHSVEATVLYEYNYRSFTLTNSEHITLSAFKKVDGEYVALTENKAVYQDTVYIKATPEEGSGYSVKSLKASYKNSYGYDSSITVSGPNDDGYYSFVVPDTNTQITVVVTEYNPTKYAGKPFVGEYVGFNLYSGKPYSEPSLSKSFSINAGGVIMVDTSEYEIGTVDEENGVIATANDGLLIGYAGNFVFSRYYLSASSVWAGDNNVYYKLDEGETKDTYKLYAVQTSDKLSNMIQVYKDGVCVDGLFLHATAADYSTYEVYTGVSFTFTTGSKVSDIGALAFDVRDADGDYICEFAGTSTATSAQLTYSVSDGLKGTYTNAEEGDLVLDGVGGATLNSETGYSYVINDDDTLTVSRETNTSKDTYVVTLGEGTYTVNSKEHETLTSSIFRGYTFTGTYLDSDGDSDRIMLIFDDKPGDITGSIVTGYYAAAHTFGFTAEYDETTQTLAITIVSELYSEGFVDQVITASVASGAITFTNTFTGNTQASAYNILNCVVSNASFILE